MEKNTPFLEYLHPRPIPAILFDNLGKLQSILGLTTQKLRGAYDAALADNRLYLLHRRGAVLWHCDASNHEMA